MSKSSKKQPDYLLDLRGDKERFIEYCQKYLNHFVEIYDNQITLIHGDNEFELTMSGIKWDQDFRFNRPESVDNWILSRIEEDEETAPVMTYSEFLNEFLD